MNDMHVHTLHSSDSTETFAAYIDRAREICAHTVCFTDHIDNHPADVGTGFYNSAAFFEDYERAKSKVR